MTQQYVTPADVEEAKQRIEQEAAEKRAALDAQQAELVRAAEEARRDAAKARLAELDATLIPENEARRIQAHAALEAAGRGEEVDVIETLIAVEESRVVQHALQTEAANLEATLGIQSTRAVPVLGLNYVDPIDQLRETIRKAARARVPTPMPLPRTGAPTATPDEQGRLERLRNHQRNQMSTFLNLTDAQINALSPEDFAAKAAEAEAEEAKRQAEVNAIATSEEQESRRMKRLRKQNAWGR